MTNENLTKAKELKDKFNLINKNCKCEHCEYSRGLIYNRAKELKEKIEKGCLDKFCGKTYNLDETIWLCNNCKAIKICEDILK